MIEKIKGYYLSCDVCGREYNIDGVNLYDSKKELTEICQENGWRRLGRKKWACDECCKKIDSYSSTSTEL